MAEDKSTSRAKKTTHDDPVAEQVQQVVDAAEGQGFYGVEVDPTPNEAYTLKGVTAGQPTPENDPEYARKVRRQLDDAARAR
ncbi:hypothetical protein [Streptomyces smyrnaeus]|uniref:hypothetical protein n=1 Tax=Streptomyces smyrnaeus TaxID=1387713 RepID=UPI00340B3A2F